jgi:hypothetical protein
MMATYLPLAFALGLGSLALLPDVRKSPGVLTTFIVAALAIVLWNTLLSRTGRKRKLEIALRKQHYIQALGEDLRRTDLAGAAVPFRHGCDLGFTAACRNLRTLTESGYELVGALPSLEDYAIILKGSKRDVRDRDPAALYTLACNQGWPDACGLAGFSGQP